MHIVYIISLDFRRPSEATVPPALLFTLLRAELWRNTSKSMFCDSETLHAPDTLQRSSSRAVRTCPYRGGLPEVALIEVRDGTGDKAGS